jgi:hypothetical protein
LIRAQICNRDIPPFLSISHRHFAHSFLDIRSPQAATLTPTTMRVAETTFFNPGLFLLEADLPDDYIPPPDLLILNQPIASFDVFSRLWGHTNYRICADGGANRLYDMFNSALEAQRENYVRIQIVERTIYLLTSGSCQMPFMETSIHYGMTCGPFMPLLV